MAREDYTVADRNTDALEAGDKIQETVQATPDAQSQSFADAAGVSHPAYVGYAEALAAHASRSDIEGLAERRLREYGNDFADGDFMRQAAYNADGTSAAAPRPGTVYGEAPDATGYTDGTPLSTAAGAPVDTDQDGIYEGAGEGPAPTPTP